LGHVRGPVPGTWPKRTGLGPRQRRLAAAEEVESPRAGGDEQGAEEVADAAAGALGRHDQREADDDRDDCEEQREAAKSAYAALLPAATITRQGAFFSTKSTVLPKIALRPG
jgi:hypothetical protein